MRKCLLEIDALFSSCGSGIHAFDATPDSHVTRPCESHLTAYGDHSQPVAESRVSDFVLVALIHNPALMVSVSLLNHINTAFSTLSNLHILIATIAAFLALVKSNRLVSLSNAIQEPAPQSGAVVELFGMETTILLLADRFSPRILNGIPISKSKATKPQFPRPLRSTPSRVSGAAPPHTQ